MTKNLRYTGAHTAHMLLVKTKIGPSSIAGIGLFADEFIPKGTWVWRFKKGLDMKFKKDYPGTLSEPAKSFFLMYAYQNPQTLNHVLGADNGRFINHSDSPNTRSEKDADDEEDATVASRDIQAGEEITGNYYEFDADPLYGFKEDRD